MALLPVNDETLPDDATLAAAMKLLAPAAPIIIMIHGFRFTPTDADRDPHSHILSLRPQRDCWKAVSWPRHLGLAAENGLAVGFGWNACGTIWRAHKRAAIAAARLARLIQSLNRVAPERPVRIIAHSLGARVALTALPRLEPGAVDRIVLMAAAAFRAESLRAMASPAGQATEVVNIVGRENTLFDLLLRAALPLRGPTLGRGLRNRDNWLDLPLGRPDRLAALAGLGHRIRPVRVTVCHWSGYLRPGIFGLYRTLLLRPAELPLSLLRAQMEPAAKSWQNTARQSFLGMLPLPFRHQAPF